MSKTVPVRDFRTHLAQLLDEVADRREHVTVTRRGRPAAVLVPVDEYEALEETADILSDEDTLLDALGELERDPEAGHAPTGRKVAEGRVNRWSQFAADSWSSPSSWPTCTSAT